jgi:hypothetical protein
MLKAGILRRYFLRLPLLRAGLWPDCTLGRRTNVFRRYFATTLADVFCVSVNRRPMNSDLTYSSVTQDAYRLTIYAGC